MTFLEFIAQHPILFIVGLWLVCSTVVDVAKIVKGTEPESVFQIELGGKRDPKGPA